jgi:cyanuric acid amidohydrolase
VTVTQKRGGGGTGAGNGLRILKFGTTDPTDVSASARLVANGYNPEDLVAVVGKTEGNGCVNDFSRTLASVAWRDIAPAGTVTIMSGGTEGVLSPHVTLVVRQRDGEERSGLVGGASETADIPKWEIGRRGQVNAVAQAVSIAMRDADLTVAQVHLVLVKCPLLTSEDVAACISQGEQPVVTDTYESMAKSRAASALGVALALGECASNEIDDALIGGAPQWSSVASISSGAELDNCHILVIGADEAGGQLRMAHAVMADALDYAAVRSLLDIVEKDRGEVVQVFAKAEADPTGRVRGYRHTMLTDSDLQSTRHARAAVAGLIAGVVGDPAIYVSGGAENQGPAGGGPIAVVYSVGASSGGSHAAR